MYTKRKFVSDIKGQLRTLNVDQHISARFILSIGSDWVKDLVSQRPLSSLVRDSQSVSELSCFEMKRVYKKDCPIAEFRLCDNIMRSKNKLPSTMLSSMGDTILSVTNAIDDVMDFVEYTRLTKPTDYSQSKKREFGGFMSYYYVHDGYLWLLNTKNKLVNIVAVFEDEREVKEVSSCQECDECDPILDDKFVCPRKYLARIKNNTVTELFNFYKRSVVDENPDQDENQKTATVQ